MSSTLSNARNHALLLSVLLLLALPLYTQGESHHGDDEFDTDDDSVSSSSSSSHSPLPPSTSPTSSGRIDSSLPLNSPLRLVPFSFYDYFTGEWDIYKSTATYTTNTLTYHHVRGKYQIEKVNHTQTKLVGRYYDNDTETSEIYNELVISLDFTDTSAGLFSTGIDEETMKPLFSFAFQQHIHGLATSVGEWQGASDSYYQFQIASPTQFTITVTPKSFSSSPTTHSTDADGIDVEDGGRIVIYTGKKLVVEGEKSFFQKYGTFAMLGAFFIINLYVKSRTRFTQTPASTVAPGVAGRVNTHGLKLRKRAEPQPASAAGTAATDIDK